jgi:hypothetical protein
MAINPNVDFTAGAILTAAQQNRFPRGVMAYVEATSNALGLNSTEVVTLTLPSFTAVANRYYKITYFEPGINLDNAGEGTTLRVRLTNVSGTVQSLGDSVSSGTANAVNSVSTMRIKTLTAGSVVLVATAQGNGTYNLYRGATQVAFLSVEDIGPA